MIEISNASATGIMEVLEWAMKHAPIEIAFKALTELKALEDKQMEIFKSL